VARKTVTRIKRTTRTVVKKTTVTAGPVARNKRALEPVLSANEDWTVDSSEDEAVTEVPLRVRSEPEPEKVDSVVEKSERIVELFARNLCPVCPSGSKVQKGDGRTNGLYCCPGEDSAIVLYLSNVSYLIFSRPSFP